MLGGLLKNKFYKKCKSATQLTKTRLEMILKKRYAMQRFLKSDIADLLKNDLDKHAYGRAEGVLVEQNLTYCYEFVEKFIEQISNNVSTMDKESECPEDCQEAVSSLIIAAARFADLPDLRDLRNLFTEKYETSLDSYVNKEFVDKLKLVHPTKDMKLQLLQDIAKESGIQWDRNDAENKLFDHLPQGANNVSDGMSQAHKNARVGNNRVERDDKKLTENPVRKSNPRPISAGRARSKVMSNEDDLGVSSTRKEQDSRLIRHRSCDVVSTSEEQQNASKDRHMRVCSDLPESKKVPDYDDLVARMAAMRKVK